MGSVVTNASVHTDICVSGSFSDIDLNCKLNSDAVTDTPCEWTLTVLLLKINLWKISFHEEKERSEKVMCLYLRHECSHVNRKR